MSVFVIETKEYRDIDRDWKKIGETTVVAENVKSALEVVGQQYKINQYIHKVILEKDSV